MRNRPEESSSQLHSAVVECGSTTQIPLLYMAVTNHNHCNEDFRSSLNARNFSHW